MCLRTINNFPNYAITKEGKVWSNKHRKFLKPYSGSGYKLVWLWKDNKQFIKSIHRLLLETFVSPCPQGMEACHNNGNKLDNRLENLRWDTRSNNVIDSIKQGTFANSKLTKDDVWKIRALYSTKKYSKRQVARMCNVAYSTTHCVINRKTWKHI